MTTPKPKPEPKPTPAPEPEAKKTKKKVRCACGCLTTVEPEGQRMCGDCGNYTVQDEDEPAKATKRKASGGKAG